MGAAIYRAIVASETTHRDIDDLVVFDTAGVEIDFMWSDSIGDVLKALLGVKGWTEFGPPRAHLAAAKAGPRKPSAPGFIGAPTERFPDPVGATPGAMDWDMNRVPLKAEFAFSFSSNVRFEVTRTLHTYGLATA
jgi:hypothetical protein